MKTQGWSKNFSRSKTTKQVNARATTTSLNYLEGIYDEEHAQMTINFWEERIDDDDIKAESFRLMGTPKEMKQLRDQLTKLLESHEDFVKHGDKLTKHRMI